MGYREVLLEIVVRAIVRINLYDLKEQGRDALKRFAEI